MHSAGFGTSIHETLVAPKVSGRGFDLRKLRSEREKALANLVDPQHLLQCVQFGYDTQKDNVQVERTHSAENSATNSVRLGDASFESESVLRRLQKRRPCDELSASHAAVHCACLAGV